VNIEVLFFGELRELAGTRKSLIFIKENASLASLIKYLAEEHGIAFRQRLNYIQGLRILINGQEYVLLGGWGTPLRDGDTVVFLPPIAGG
jgi:molybdopterin converting factor small subunit